MNKEQAMLKVAALEKELSEVNKELAQLKQIINEPEPINSFKRCRAKLDGRYYYVGMGGDIYVSFEDNDSIDIFRYAIGNYFQTKEEAEEYRDKLIFNQSVIDRIAELNEGWTPDWSDEYNYKYSFCYNCKSKKLQIEEWTAYKDASDNKYFKSPGIGVTILKEFDNEKLIKWFI